MYGSPRAFFRKCSTLLLTAVIAAAPLHAELARVGPNNPDPRVGNYPAWYQDKTGLALEFCAPATQSEVDGGWCLLLPGDVNIPEAFPGNYFDEHFWYAADATLTPATGARANLVLAVEAAFAGGPAKIGDQVTFARIRIRLAPVPVTGTYRVIHPYGEDLIDAAAGDRIFLTDDFGLGLAGGPFDLLLNGRLGPFLLPSAIPGGPEMPAVSAQNPTPDQDPAHFGGVFAPTPYPNTGKLYIADPARIGPVTGSTLPDFLDSTGALRNHNIFRIEGPAGSNLGGPGVDFVETTDFSLMGRVFTGTMPGDVNIDRASYSKTNSSVHLDVFATGFPTSPGRIPTQPVPQAALPQLTFFDAPCSSATDQDGNPVEPFGPPTGSASQFQMFNAGSDYWGQAPSDANTVCVKDNNARDTTGAIVPAYFPHNVVDEVTIDQATYNPSTATLSVTAHSSDEATNPALTLLSFGKTPDTPLNGNSVSVTDVSAPPAVVRVHSARGGQAELAVKTSLGSVPNPPNTPVAANDATSLAEDSGAKTIDVLNNDTGIGTSPTINITSAPRLGTATIDTTSTPNRVIYTPNPDAFGNDSFNYTVTNGTATSNTAIVSVTITPVNDAPVAANDTANALATQNATINVLANDTDADGASDLSTIQNLSAVTRVTGTGTATATQGTGGNVVFNATGAGTYTFTYRAVDASGTPSANTATVTVNVSAAEQITIAQAEFRTGQSRLRINGTISPIAQQTVTIKWINAAGVRSGVVTTAPTDVTGAYAIDQRPATGILDPRNFGAVAVEVTGPGGGRQTLNLTTRQ